MKIMLNPLFLLSKATIFEKRALLKNPVLRKLW
jgi:hypothetical protein